MRINRLLSTIETKNMTDNLEKTILKINKKFGENTIGRINNMPTVVTERVSSGSPYLDWAIGGGWPLGKTIELYGPYSSGKSLIALRTVAEAQKKKLLFITRNSSFPFPTILHPS